MMSFNDEQIREVTESVWTSMLGAQLAPASGRRQLDTHARYVFGCVHSSGGWEGAVTIACSTAFARRAAGTMFELTPESASLDEVRDALGELTNIVGGNIKAMLPGPSKLSLPTVTEGTDYSFHVQGSAPLREVWFECDGEPLVVSVLTRADARC